MLNNIARNCYSNSEIGATGYSINLDTVLGVMADAVVEDYKSSVGEQPYTYNSGFFPTVWYDNERESWSDAVGNKSKDFGLTKSDSTRGTNISPYKTSWTMDRLLNDSSWKNANYSDLVRPNSRTTYLLATRVCHIYTSYYAHFGLYWVGNGQLQAVTGWASNSKDNGTLGGHLRPMIKLPLSQINGV